MDLSRSKSQTFLRIKDEGRKANNDNQLQRSSSLPSVQTHPSIKRVLEKVPTQSNRTKAIQVLEKRTSKQKFDLS